MAWTSDIEPALRDFAANPIVLYLACWFASGIVLARTSGRFRLAALAASGFLLQALLRKSNLLAFELFNLLTYAFAASLWRWEERTRAGIDPEGDPDARREIERGLDRRRWRCCCLGMLGLIAAFAASQFLKSHTPADQGTEWRVEVLLDGFQLLILITFLFEVGAGVEPLPSPGLFLLWSHLPPVGAIIRLSELTPRLGELASALKWREAFSWGGLALVATGLAKCGVAFAMGRASPESFFPSRPYLFKSATIFVFAPWGFYLYGAGLNDIQRVIGKTWNLAVPPMYDWPMFRQNLSRFWASWNMTMTSVYRDYLFFARWGMERPNVYVNSVVVFVAMGLWHSFNWYWLLFGVYHAAGFCAFLAYQQWARRRRAPAAPPGRLRAVAAWALTYFFVCLGWYVPGKILQYVGIEGVK